MQRRFAGKSLPFIMLGCTRSITLILSTTARQYYQIFIVVPVFHQSRFHQACCLCLSLPWGKHYNVRKVGVKKKCIIFIHPLDTCTLHDFGRAERTFKFGNKINSLAPLLNSKTEPLSTILIAIICSGRNAMTLCHAFYAFPPFLPYQFLFDFQRW